MNAYYVKSKPIGKVPCTKLCQSLDGQYLAVGGSDGRVTVVDSDSLAEVQSFEAHDLPVTGLCFAPSVVAEGLGTISSSYFFSFQLLMLVVVAFPSLLHSFRCSIGELFCG